MRRQDQGLWIGLAALLLVLVAAAVLGGGMMAAGTMGPGMMGWYGLPSAGIGWMWSLGWLAMFLFWAAIVALPWLVFRRLSGGSDSRHSEPSESPGEILKRRYAAGDISREQFEEMERVMQGQS